MAGIETFPDNPCRVCQGIEFYIRSNGKRQCKSCHQRHQRDWAGTKRTQEDIQHEAHQKATERQNEKVRNTIHRWWKKTAPEKECLGCHVVKTREEYPIQNGRMETYCKECKNKAVTNYTRIRRANGTQKPIPPEKTYQYKINSKLRDPERYRAQHQAMKHRRRAQLQAVGGHFTAQEWRDLKKQYNYTCLCCGKQEPEISLTVDHVIPISKGGSNYISNIQPLCHMCNSIKCDDTKDYR